MLRYMMNEQEYEQLKEFYIYVQEQLTLDDYENILSEFAPIRKGAKIWSLKTVCHNDDLAGVGYNLRFNLETRTFFCWSECNTSFNIFTLLKQIYKTRGENKSNIQCLKLVCEYKDIPFNFKIQDNKPKRYRWEKDLRLYISKSKQYDELKVLDKNILKSYSQLYHEDFLKSGISLETMEKYNIRYYEYRDQIVIPCFNINGELIGIRIKNVNKILLDDGFPKYCPLKTLNGTEYNFATSQNFYGINYNKDHIKQSKEVWLVEGERSVLIADTWFGDKSKVLALYGSNLGENRVKQLIELGVRKVVIFLDSDFKQMYDEQGEKNKEFVKFEEKVMKIKDELYNYVDEIDVVYNNIGLDMYKDNAFDVGKDGFLKLWNNREVLK